MAKVPQRNIKLNYLQEIRLLAHEKNRVRAFFSHAAFCPKHALDFCVEPKTNIIMQAHIKHTCFTHLCIGIKEKNPPGQAEVWPPTILLLVIATLSVSTHLFYNKTLNDCCFVGCSNNKMHSFWYFNGALMSFSLLLASELAAVSLTTRCLPRKANISENDSAFLSGWLEQTVGPWLLFGELE